MPKIGVGLKPKADSPSPTDNPQQPTANSQQPKNNPFTADQLRDAWVGLAQVHADEPRLRLLIENYMPLLKENFIAEIQMPNPWQMDQMRKALPSILTQLRQTLRNDLLEIQVVQAEYNQEQMAFTSEEKYKLMLESNPVLGELRDRLDLRLD